MVRLGIIKVIQVRVSTIGWSYEHITINWPQAIWFVKYLIWCLPDMGYGLEPIQVVKSPAQITCRPGSNLLLRRPALV